MALMRTDIGLKTKQAFWETPRNLVIIIGGCVAAAAALSGWVGFAAGQRAQTGSVVIQLAPGVVVTQPTK